MQPKGFPLSRREDERGAATVVAAMAMTLLVALTAAGVYLGAAVVARHRAQAAADLAAVTGATMLVGGPVSACEQAAAVAARMGAHLTACDITGLDVVVSVDVEVNLGRFAAGPARAQARAGPVR